MPSVKKSPINQRFLRFWKKNRCVFLFPQSEDISRGLPQGDRLWGTGDIHFGERILFGKSGFVIGAHDEGYRTISNPISESD